MSKFSSPDRVLEALSAPMGDLIASVGRAVADAQRALDAQTIANFLEIYGEGNAALEELRRLGYQPTWYHLPDTTAELRVALTIKGAESQQGSAIQPKVLSTPGGLVVKKVATLATPVNAMYGAKFNYDVRAAAKLTFKVVPVPPSPGAAEMTVAPDFLTETTTVAEARERLVALGIEYGFSNDTEEIADDAKITAQDPPPGELLPGGTLLLLTPTTT